MAKKRPNYVTELVNKTNDYLLKKNMYEGYNFFKMEYNSYLKKDVIVYAGSYKEDEFDFLQIM